MSAPAQNAFLGKTTRPSASDLEKALGRAKPLWARLVAELASEQDVTTREWKSYGAKSGWSLRLMRGKRTIVWLAPDTGCFQVAFIFGEKALTAIRQSAVPARVLRMLDEAPKYPEGTGLRFQIKAVKDIALVKNLAASSCSIDSRTRMQASKRRKLLLPIERLLQIGDRILAFRIWLGVHSST